MRNTLICTVGTSLKGNLERSPDSKFTELLRDKNTQGIALALGDIDPGDHLAGAEINSISGILKKGLIGERLHLYLLVSDTMDGAFIGGTLKNYYERRQNPWAFEKVVIKKLEGLTDQDPKRFRSDGLKNLVKAIAEIVRRHNSASVLINATGGYKAQISFAGMIGQALEIPVCYLFERFSEVIELPPQPIAMDMGFWLAHAPLFYALADEGTDTNPTEQDLRFDSLVEAIDENGERLVQLSATGQLFHETFQYRFGKQRESLLPPDSGLAPEDKVIKYEDQNEGRHKGLVGYLNNLCNLPYVERIYTASYNPSLPLKNYFRPSKDGEISKVEGGYSDGKATTKFNVVTTAKTTGERDAVLADLPGMAAK